MKLRYTAVLAFLLLASCTPSIEQSTTRAEAAADRANRSATVAEQSDDQAFKASVQALIAADDAEDDSRRANGAVSRLETPTVKRGELLLKPTQGSPLYWCLMSPPILQGGSMGSESVGYDEPRSRFWVDEIFDSKSDCLGALRKIHRQFVGFTDKRRPFKKFCAACSNEGEDADDEN